MFAEQKKENEMGAIDQDKEAQLPNDNAEEVHNFGNDKKGGAEMDSKQEVAGSIYGIGSGVDEEAKVNLNDK